MYYFVLKIKKINKFTVSQPITMKIFSSHKIKEKGKVEATAVKLFQQKKKHIKPCRKKLTLDMPTPPNCIVQSCLFSKL